MGVACVPVVGSRQSRLLGTRHPMSTARVSSVLCLNKPASSNTINPHPTDPSSNSETQFSEVWFRQPDTQNEVDGDRVAQQVQAARAPFGTPSTRREPEINVIIVHGRNQRSERLNFPVCIHTSQQCPGCFARETGGIKRLTFTWMCAEAALSLICSARRVWLVSD